MVVAVSRSDDERSEQPPDREIVSRFDVPDEWKIGLHANEVNVWYTPYEFTLTIPHTVVAHIRIPVGLVFGVIKAINASMTGYERDWGTIQEPEWQGSDPESDGSDE